MASVRHLFATGCVVENGDEHSFRLPGHRAVQIGRGPAADVVLSDVAAPRQLATLVPVEVGWVALNARKTRMLLASSLVTAEVQPRGSVIIGKGESILTWPELDVDVRIILVVTGIVPDQRVPEAGPPLGRSRDRFARATTVAPLGRQRNRVHLADRLAASRSREVEVTDDLRHTMAVLFRHLLTGGPSPRNLYMAAAVELETTPEAVKQASKRLRDRINRERVQRLEDVKALGHYLITTTRSVTEADLDVTRTTE